MSNLPISQIGNYMGDQLEKLLRVTVLETDNRLKLQTPVDSGRMRVSWQIGENSADGAPASEGSYGAGIAPPKGTNYQPGQEKLGNYYSIHNNLPYAEPVANGTNLPPSWGGQYRTRQGTVPGYPDLIAREMQRFVDQNWERIKRQG
jgi:hypothetical protein